MWMLVRGKGARWRIRNTRLRTTWGGVPPSGGCPTAAEVNSVQTPLLECSGTAGSHGHQSWSKGRAH
jgi:hypothetical protein